MSDSNQPAPAESKPAPRVPDIKPDPSTGITIERSDTSGETRVPAEGETR